MYALVRINSAGNSSKNPCKLFFAAEYNNKNREAGRRGIDVMLSLTERACNQICLLSRSAGEVLAKSKARGKIAAFIKINKRLVCFI